MNNLNEKYKVHIVIPTKNCYDLLTQTINSITDKQLHVSDTFTNFDIYIIDTGSSDSVKSDIRLYQSQLPHVKFHNIYVNGYNFAKVNNYVIKNSIKVDTNKQNLVLLCNNDLKLLTDCITEFVMFHDTHKNVGTVGCKLLFEDRTIQHAGQHVIRTPEDNGFWPTHRGLHQPHTRYSENQKIIGNTAALAMIDLDLFLDIGGLDEKYSFGFEDLQLNLDCMVKGKDNYYLGTSVSYHYESITKNREGYDQARQARLSNKDYHEVFQPYVANNADFFNKKFDDLGSQHIDWLADSNGWFQGRKIDQPAHA